MLSFTDIPGEALTAHDSPAAAKLRESIDRSAVLFIAIDSPALMERNGEFNEEVNKPALVAEFVRDAAAKMDNLLVILVPLKCEKYAAQPDGMRQLKAKVTDSYFGLVSQLSGLESASCGVVLTPVQTVGSMIFSRFDPDGLELFRLSRLGATYSPQDTDQPLRWMLRFVVNGYQHRNKRATEHVIDWFFGHDIRFAAAIKAFGAGCKQDADAGFDVLLRHRFLDLS